MKVFFLALIATILGIGVSMTVKAQTVSCKIMDTGIDWTNSGGGGVDGQLKVFLTDTMGIAGLSINYGSTDTTANYFSGNYSTLGSFYSSSGTVSDGMLSIPIGHFTEGVTGYLRVSVLLRNSSHNDIDVLK